MLLARKEGNLLRVFLRNRKVPFTTQEAYTLSLDFAYCQAFVLCPKISKSNIEDGMPVITTERNQSPT